MMTLLTSLQLVHLQHHPQGKWDDLKIELLGEEDAAKVRARIAETAAYKRAQRGYCGLYCAHCKKVGDAVTLAEHVNLVYVFISFQSFS